MATPLDLEDFAIGFSLTERIVASADDIQSLDIVPLGGGVELRMWLKKPLGEALSARRRHFAGPTGCGLCGVDSLSEALRAPPKVGNSLQIKATEVAEALDSLPPHSRSIARRAPFMPPASGGGTVGSSPSARTSAVTTPLINWWARWPAAERVAPMACSF